MNELFARPTAFIELGESAKSMLALLALCTARLYVLAIIFPPMGDSGLQGTVRNAVCLCIGFFMAWGQPLHIVDGLTTLQFILLVLKEGVLGLMLGFACAIVFWVAEAVGALIDNQAGFNNVQQTNPASGSESTPIGNVMGQLSHACFWILGGMMVLVSLLFESYTWWPMNRMTPDWSQVLQHFVQTHLSRLMRTTITLAAPTLLVLLLIDLGFGLIGKTAEKLEPNNLAQPIKGAVALMMVALLVALFFQEARPMLALTHLHEEISAWLETATRGAGQR
jgi:type III secretion protein T